MIDDEFSELYAAPPAAAAPVRRGAQRADVRMATKGISLVYRRGRRTPEPIDPGIDAVPSIDPDEDVALVVHVYFPRQAYVPPEKRAYDFMGERISFKDLHQLSGMRRRTLIARIKRVDLGAMTLEQAVLEKPKRGRPKGSP